MSDFRQSRPVGWGKLVCMMLDDDLAYRAAASKDSRFDGQFILAVKTTGIYCRPACPARVPLRRNVNFYPTAAAAQAAGFRACRRCQPDAAPGSPDWNLRADTVGAAMRLINDGVVDREGVPGLAGRLGYTPRHLNRMLTAELGASPLALARARRAHTARVLLVSTELPMADIAFAAGFSSIRQFNDTIGEVFATTPSTLRDQKKQLPASPGSISLRLAVRAPFDSLGLIAFFAQRSIAGVEHLDGLRYSRTLLLPHGPAVVELDLPAPGAAPVVLANLRLSHPADLAPAVSRCRRLLDADADPIGIDTVLAADPALADSVARTPGIRLPGTVDGTETLVRAVLGQQVSVAAARTAARRLTETVGRPLELEGAPAELTHLFPEPAALAELTVEQIGGPRRRAATLLAAVRDIADGSLVIDPGRISSELQAELCARDGFGPWTSGYLAMRVVGDSDVLMTGDLVLRNGAGALGLPTDPKALTSHAERWRPFRAYAGMHLWRNAPARVTTTARTNERD